MKSVAYYLFGIGAVKARSEGRWYRTPAMNSSPILDIPWRVVDPSDAANTFFPFWDKLICTCEPEPMSSNAYLITSQINIQKVKRCAAAASGNNLRRFHE